MTSPFRRLVRTIYPIGPGIYQNQMKYPFGQKRPIKKLGKEKLKGRAKLKDMVIFCSLWQVLSGKSKFLSGNILGTSSNAKECKKCTVPGNLLAQWQQTLLTGGCSMAWWYFEWLKIRLPLVRFQAGGKTFHLAGPPSSSVGRAAKKESPAAATRPPFFPLHLSFWPTHSCGVADFSCQLSIWEIDFNLRMSNK